MTAHETERHKTEQLLQDMRNALASIPKQYPTAHPRWIAVMSEGVVNLIQQLEKQLEVLGKEPQAEKNAQAMTSSEAKQAS